MWIRRKVQSGNKLGRKLSSPTLNFKVGNFGKQHKPGVYVSQVRIAGRTYKGALYYGPKFPKNNDCLEVYIFDFNKSIYGEFVSFQVGKKVRAARIFGNLDELKQQIKKDIEDISKV